MRMLFSIDKRDYDPAAPVFVRPSARGIICPHFSDENTEGTQ